MIKGKKITVRAIQEKDIALLFASNSDIENHGANNNRLIYSESEYYREFRQTGLWNMESGGWLVGVRHEDNVPIVQVGVRYVSPLVFSLHYHLLDRKLSGNGYTTEAVELICYYMFSIRPNQRIQASVSEHNPASARVLQKNHFVEEGRLRKSFFTEGGWRDWIMYGLIREDWERLKMDKLRGG